ncbi:WD40 repeat-containing protein [Xenococcus sp. PCC 7305]|nr:WD40 repeat-containing protein [Xenococcus sp. PCC 7305]
MCPRAVQPTQPINPPTQLGKLWVLLVGINHYNDVELPSLSYSALDCQGLGEAISEATDKSRELVLHHDFADRKPELETVRTSLKEIVTSARSGDTILFYFSGHGILDAASQKVYLCLADTQKKQLTNTGLSLNEILRLLGNCQADQQLIWLDACHSGGMSLRRTTNITLPNPTSQLVKVLRRKAEKSQGFYALLSCDHSQQSWEFPELGHGVFTYYLMRGLRGEAVDSQGIIDADTLYQYVYHQTLRYIDRSNQQIRLINQQKSSRGERQLQSEYTLQTPKRIVEGFGKVIIGQWGVSESTTVSRQALVVDGCGSNQTTLDLSKVLRGKGGFNVEYFPSKGKKWSDIQETIASCLNSSVNAEATTTFLYLRGKVKYSKAGEAWLSFKDGAHISREWLRKIIYQSRVTQQIIVLDLLNSEGIKEWLEELRLEYDRGQCIISYSRKPGNPLQKDINLRDRIQQFTQTLVSTLNKGNPETGLSVAAWISQLQIELAGSELIPEIWLSGTRGVIEVLPEKSKNRKNQAGTTILDINVCPYMGLQAFTEENAQYFYGRDALVQRLVNHINHETTLAVIGASGSGKSSIVRAGLFHQLSQGKRIPQSDRWLLKCFRPGTNPFLALAQCLSNEPGQQGTTQLRAPIEELLSQGVEGFVQWLRTRPEPMVVLVVDQFEELFTLTSESERTYFINLLLETLAYASDRFKLILTLRADFIASCLEISKLSQILQQYSILVPPYLTESEYREAIVKPATQVGLKVEPGLEDILLQDLSGGSGDLPLLQFVLQKLWENRQIGRLTLGAYRKLGGIKGALEQQAQELYESLDEEMQEAARWIFLNLTKIGDGTEDTRRRVRKSDLIVPKYPAPLIEKTLKKLTDAKLIVTNLPRSIVTGASRGDSQFPDYEKMLQEAIQQEPTVEVVHEVLIRNWSTLRWWLEENRSRLKLQRQIEQAAILWKNKNEQPDFLLRGIRLTEAEEMFHEYRDELMKVSQNFIQACLEQRDQEKKEQASRSRNSKITVAGLVLCGIILPTFTWSSYRQKLISQLENVDAKNASSEALLLSNQQLQSILAGVKASEQLNQMGKFQRKLLGKQRWDGIETRTAAVLQQAIYGTQELNLLQGHSQKVNAIAHSSDGNLIATASDDETIKIWNKNGELLDTLSGHKNKVSNIAFKPNLDQQSAESPTNKSYILASGSADTTAIIWRITNNQAQQIQQLQGHSDQITDIAFKNNIIATASHDGTIKLWQENGNLITTLLGHRGPVNTIETSADYLLSGGKDGIIIVWQINNNRARKIRTIQASDKEITSIAITNDQKTIISVIDYWEVISWNVNDGEQSESQNFSANRESINDIVLSPDDQFLANGTLEGKINVYNSQGSLQQTLIGHGGAVLDLAFRPLAESDNQNYLVASASTDKTVRLWRFSSGASLEDQGISSIVNSPVDSATLATADTVGNIKIWRINPENNQQELIDILSEQEETINQLAYSQDGKMLASASADNTVKIWDTASRELITTLQVSREQSISQLGVNSIVFSQDRNLLISGNEDQTITIWDLTTNEIIANLEEHSDRIKTIILSPDNKFIVSAGDDQTIKIWNIQGDLLQTIEAHNLAINSLQFSNDGTVLASASSDNTIKLWQVKSSGNIDPQPLQILSGHQNGITSLVFSKNGNLLVSGGGDRTVKLWRTQEGTLLKTLQGHSSKVTSVSLINDGKTIISADEQQGLLIWNLELDNLLAQGCDRIANYLKYNSNVAQRDRNICD